MTPRLRDLGNGSRFALAIVAVLFATGLGFHLIFASAGEARFEIGSMDRDYLAEPSSFHERLRMNGPIRHDDSSVEVIDFYGRLTKRDATLRLPYHAFNSPIQVFIRCHRFGLEGSVHLEANGESVGEFVFAKSSYPWGGIRAVVPQSVAEKAPLRLRLVTEGGEQPGDHLPADVGVGIDWLSLTPMSGAAKLKLTGWQYVAVVGLPLLALSFALFVGFERRQAVGFMTLVAAGELALFAAWPFETWMALRRLWVVLPLGGVVYLLLHPAQRRSLVTPEQRRWLSVGFAGIVVAHSTLIFFPNHAPPDLWNHLPQINWLHELELDWDELHRYASSSDPFDDGHVRPHFGVDYGAPYPPMFYLLTYMLSLIHDDTRFLVEFVSVVIAASITIVVFLLSRAMGLTSRAAALGTVLAVTEIAIWHHAHRVHAPGSLGELAFILWLLTLALGFRGDDDHRPLFGVALAAVTAATALSYPATLLHLGIYLSVLVGLIAASQPRRHAIVPLVGATSAGFAVAFIAYYYPYALQAFQKSDMLLDRVSYDPPATFYFLRNQMRDTVRILQNGYPLYVLLSGFGLALVLKRTLRIGWFHRAMLVAAVIGYLAMLVLKDPALFPMIFLHAKEDLFFAPIACILGGVALSRAWDWRPAGRVAVALLVGGLFALAVRDQAKNHNTLKDQRVTSRVHRLPLVGRHPTYEGPVDLTLNNDTML